MNVSKKWIKQNVSKLYCVGGQITQDNWTEYVDSSQRSFETTLSKKGVESVEMGEFEGKFNILLPGHGWAECWAHANEVDMEPEREPLFN